jgi:hypothetical protein
MMATYLTYSPVQLPQQQLCEELFYAVKEGNISYVG